MKQQLLDAGLVAPIVLKSLAACGIKDAHAMTLLLSLDRTEALPPFSRPIVAQQFVNHGGLVHKVSVIGSQVSTCSG